MGIIDGVLDAFQAALKGLHDLIEPLAGVHAWGWAIIALTLVVRILLLPLAIKQIRSMRAMQALQPQLKEIQKKYKVDRELMRKDPDQYRAKKQKLNEEMMALYQKEGVNPAASCLPLLAQAPVFLALFNVLRGERAAELAQQPFYFITSQADQGLTTLVNSAGWPGWVLVVLMATTMFISQKQTMARQLAMGGDNPMAQQQKILLYAMPLLLAFFSFNIPLGVLLYWVTTNAFQAIQQAIMLREVKHEVADGSLADRPGGEAAAPSKGRFKRGGSKKGGAADDAPAAPPAGNGRRSNSATSGGKPVPGTDPASDPGAAAEPDSRSNGSGPDATGPSTSGPAKEGGSTGPDRPSKPTKPSKPEAGGNGSPGRRSGHLPTRRDR